MPHISLSLTKLGIVNFFCLTFNTINFLQNELQLKCCSILQKRITTSNVPKLGRASFVFRMGACELLYQ